MPQFAHTPGLSYPCGAGVQLVRKIPNNKIKKPNILGEAGERVFQNVLIYQSSHFAGTVQFPLSLDRFQAAFETCIGFLSAQKLGSSPTCLEVRACSTAGSLGADFIWETPWFSFQNKIL
ncbi:WD and tetratricopeptide repeats protein 1 [Platysternon megacephalum]|uniref:WD and tetratricopeptide repeats protein 1 n=1 Tax=Platysternon megacephalum TaxID=55544 RepID=A0A4D9F3F5_9SAUR|nr:WD and tetratricopeptide repeats protein 1 [Platysternon megacephalum]